MSGKKTVAVGMSGGVDSSVAAYLLMQQGYEVVGITMDFWHNDKPEDIYKNLSDAYEAKQVCDQLGIRHIPMNFTGEFKKYVEDVFAAEYRKGRTPNPCIVCNRFVKWEALLRRAGELGIDLVATGHYARIRQVETGRLAVTKARSDSKDQTYVLYKLTQEQLRRTLFPIGEYEKTEIRRIASELGLVIADKKDSQDICFIDDGDYAGYLERRWQGDVPPEGSFVSVDKKPLGRHKGIHHYTIGQRKGLGISGEHPYFVCGIDAESDTVILGEDKDVWGDSLEAEDVNMMGEETFDGERIYTARIRYSHKGCSCRVSLIGNDRIRVSFLEPVRAVTPGQAVVIYDGDYIVGGATI
ncbi:MAG: tRNA 2-thiouridine(34) synthase MnmA, partial [Lachnospiraceae bacterium]|nr:tRNA 2-thiouridine(34) synthase MnmA [Lachnospiraceae bacterium]